MTAFHLIGALCALFSAIVAGLHLVGSRPIPNFYARVYTLVAMLFLLLAAMDGFNKVFGE